MWESRRLIPPQIAQEFKSRNISSHSWRSCSSRSFWRNSRVISGRSPIKSFHVMPMAERTSLLRAALRHALEHHWVLLSYVNRQRRPLIGVSWASGNPVSTAYLLGVKERGKLKSGHRDGLNLDGNHWSLHGLPSSMCHLSMSAIVGRYSTPSGGTGALRFWRCFSHRASAELSSLAYRAIARDAQSSSHSTFSIVASCSKTLNKS